MFVLITFVVVHGCLTVRANKVKRPNVNFQQQNQGTKHIYIRTIEKKSDIL